MLITMYSENARDDVRMFFFGSPLMDVTANVGDDVLGKYRLDRDNAYVVDETNRGLFDEVRATSVQVGGSVTNTARTVCRLRGSPRNVTYLGTVGDDEYGEMIKKQLGKEGLSGGLRQVGGNTGKVAVLLMGKARTLVTDLGVSRSFSLDEETWRRISDGPSLVYLSGFFISVSLDTITKLATTSQTVAFNLGAPFLSKKFPQEMTHLYENASIVFGNEAEHRAFAQIHNITSNHVVEVVAATNRRFDNKSRVVVVTRGGGAVVVFHDSDWQVFEVKKVVEVVDSNGAGDAFAGGFLARYVEGDSIANCVRSGVEVAGRVIQRVGFNLD
ncbi:adenosine kinase-like isoform X1 [Zophobas morio]|uniref:adenosine kinase-like isoform X1 n=1 Tax=Zophobas morio TaxID=2755281 RepID=UPI00308328EA